MEMVQVCGLLASLGCWQGTAGSINSFSMVTDWAQALVSLPVGDQNANLLCPVKMVKALYQIENKN